MDVVSDARAVLGGVVVAENAHARQAPRGHTRHVGQEVIGNAVRIFTDQARSVRADRVEVAQAHGREIRPCGADVFENIFDKKLGAPVGVGDAPDGMFFC